MSSNCGSAENIWLETWACGPEDCQGWEEGHRKGTPPTPKQCFQMGAIKAFEGLVKTHIAGLHPRVSACLECSSRFRASNKFPGDGHR